jgi:hypothetical protein
MYGFLIGVLVAPATLATWVGDRKARHSSSTL